MRMSQLFPLLLALVGTWRASAQVQVEVSFEQQQFLPGESAVVAVKIINRSGQPLSFGADNSWLTFDVEALDGSLVRQLQDPPVAGPFSLESSQQGIKRINLTPCFDFKNLGRYTVSATLHMRDWGRDFASKPVEISVIPGAKIWEQTFGITSGTNRLPEMRKYILDEANYLSSGLRLYVCVTSEDGSRIFRVCNLGPKVSFGFPDSQVDAAGKLHVLWQTGSSLYAYKQFSSDGDLLAESLYDYVNARPRLTLDDRGEVNVTGGVRRLTPQESPVVHAPNELPIVRMPNELPAGGNR